MGFLEQVLCDFENLYDNQKYSWYVYWMEEC